MTRLDDRTDSFTERLGNTSYLAAITLVLFFLAGLVVLYHFNPLQASFYPPCPFHLLTGLHCPGCGSTRALHALLHGRIREAFGYNPLLFVTLSLVGYEALRILFARKGIRLFSPLGSPFFSRLFLIVILLFTVLRNLPDHPFTLLAP